MYWFSVFLKKIFRCASFQKFEIFPKIWNFSKNLKFFQNSKIFPKISNFSKNLIFLNLKFFTKSENVQKSVRSWHVSSSNVWKVTNVFGRSLYVKRKSTVAELVSDKVTYWAVLDSWTNHTENISLFQILSLSTF